jgi:diguanylate cyclase (GGDEF)-like protein
MTTQIATMMRARGLSARRRMELGGESGTVALLATAFIFAAVTLPLAAGSARHVSVAVVCLCVGVYALASLVQFEIGGRPAAPTQLVFVPMLFVLPTAWVPLAAVAGLMLGDCARRAMRARGARSPFDLVASSWFTIGPALVLLAAGEGPPMWSRWPVYVAALAAQFGCDAIATAVRHHAVRRAPLVAGIAAMAGVYAVDAACSPAGLAFAIPAAHTPSAILIAVPLLAFAAFFARDRAARIESLMELSETYRGTAAMLGDVIEADDAYTADHSREVVNLSLAVADALQLGTAMRREVEFTALLHDVGKLRIPKHLITKSGPLTADERALMETHTLEGHALLSRGGGFLSRIGALVRSCHERYDGTGYPDRLAGADIPLPARIVSCCDAFDAMTSDRPYRRALPLDVAVNELRNGAGTHFDPTIAAALIRIIEGDELAARVDDAPPRLADHSASGATARAAGPSCVENVHDPRVDVERLGAGKGIAPAVAAYAGGGLFAVIALALPLLDRPAFTLRDLGVFAAFTVAYALAYGIEFQVGPGSAIPTQLVFVPMLALMTPSLIPLAVGVAIIARSSWDEESCSATPGQRPFILLQGGWYTLGPVIIVAASGNATLTWSTLLAVLAVQIVTDAAVHIVRVHFVLGFPLRPLVFSLAWAYLTDIALTPIAFTAVAPVAHGAAALSILLLIGFLAMLAGDRKRHLEQASSLTDAYREASARARRDPLTGLGNRLAWDEALRGIGEGRRAAVILADVNGLKAANDTRGHAYGDAILTEVAGLLRKAAPQAAAIARLGGDEFGILLVDDHAESHRHTTRYLRSLFAMHPGIEGEPISAAIGSQSTPPLPDIATVIERADAAVYADKASLARAV